MKTEFGHRPGSSNNPPRVRRDRLAGRAFGCSCSSGHCVRGSTVESPSATIDILGSYFPAWMICIVSGLTLTLIGRWIVQWCI